MRFLCHFAFFCYHTYYYFLLFFFIYSFFLIIFHSEIQPFFYSTGPTYIFFFVHILASAFSLHASHSKIRDRKYWPTQSQYKKVFRCCITVEWKRWSESVFFLRPTHAAHTVTTNISLLNFFFIYWFFSRSTIVCPFFPSLHTAYAHHPYLLRNKSEKKTRSYRICNRSKLNRAAFCILFHHSFLILFLQGKFTFWISSLYSMIFTFCTFHLCFNSFPFLNQRKENRKQKINWKKKRINFVIPRNDNRLFCPQLQIKSKYEVENRKQKTKSIGNCVLIWKWMCVFVECWN